MAASGTAKSSTAVVKTVGGKEGGGNFSGWFEVMVGTRVEILDYCNIWRMGEVRQIDTWDKTVLIRYEGGGDADTDEWHDVASGRLRQVKNTANNTFKIPKADRAMQLALASSLESPTQALPNVTKLTVKERRVPQFRKGTFVIATWVDGLMYPAVILRVLNDVSFVVEFVDGMRWTLGSHCFVRTLTKNEYERLIYNPHDAPEILGSRLRTLGLMSPEKNSASTCSPAATAPPPKKRFRFTSPSPATPLAEKNTNKTQKPVETKRGRQIKQTTVFSPPGKQTKKAPEKSRKSLPPPSKKTPAPVTTSAAPATTGRNSRRKSAIPSLDAVPVSSLLEETNQIKSTADGEFTSQKKRPIKAKEAPETLTTNSEKENENLRRSRRLSKVVVDSSSDVSESANTIVQDDDVFSKANEHDSQLL